jgi:sugar lactone lactonase YvrE
MFPNFNNIIRFTLRSLSVLGLSAILLACGGGGDSTDTSTSTQSSTDASSTSTSSTSTSTSSTGTGSYTIGGTLSGLAEGQSVTMADVSSGQKTTLSANGSYTALTNVPSGTTYSFRVSAQPSGQICGISNASGRVASASVSNVAVSCSTLVLNLLAGSVGSSNNANAIFNSPRGIATDATGNVYVADTNNQTIHKVTPAGEVSILAGSTRSWGSADGTGTAARFNSPQGLATDSAGNVYVADTGNNAIRKITPAGEVSTLAGGTRSWGSADGTGTAARFNFPQGLATDSAGNVYVADTNNQTIRKITPAGEVSTLAGSARSWGSTDGTGTAARFNFPRGITTDSAGNLYVADTNNQTIRKITPAGEVSTLAGSAGNWGSTDGTGAAARFNSPRSITADATGNLYVADTNNQTIRKITPAGEVSTLAGSSRSAGSADGTGTAARFNFPRGIAADATGNLYVADTNNQTIRKITAVGVVSTLAGSSGSAGSADGTSTVARFNSPIGLATDSAGNIYVADTNNHTIRKITPAGEVSTWAGSAGNAGSVDATGTAAQFNYPRGIAIDATDNLYVADTENSTIRKITPAGEVSTLAGSVGSAGSADGAGAAAQFNSPQGLATDSAGNVYVADTNNQTIRKITAAGMVSTFAGSSGSAGSVDGTGTVARFNSPIGLATDSAGNIYVADTNNHTIRKITPAGEVSIWAGSAGNAGSVNGTGTAARFNSPQGLAIDIESNVYVADTNNHTVRKITPAGVVSTVVGKV